MGDGPRRDCLTILDEVMAWALVAEDNWGVTARMTWSSSAPVPIGPQVRAEGWIAASGAACRYRGQCVDPATGNVLADGRGGLRRGARRAQARAERTLRRSARASTPGRPATTRRRAERRATRPITARAVAFVAEEARGRALGPASPSSSTIPTPSPVPSAPASRAGRPGLPRGPAPGRAGPRGDLRRPLAADSRPSSAASARRPARERPDGYLELADRLFREAELELRWFAFDLLDRLLPADPERTWQLLRRAAREATTGSPSTRSPIPTAGGSC